MHPYFAPSELWGWDMFRTTFARDFAWTLLAEVGVFILILSRHRSPRPRRCAGDGRFRIKAPRPSAASGWWLLPIYVWAVEAHLQTLAVIDAYSTGLVSPPWSWVVLGLYEIFFALGCLVGVQTLLVAATGGQALTLGVEGKARTAATAALLAVTTDVLLYLGASRWLMKEAAGAL